MPLADLKAGQHGEVWTVFRGTKPEPFAVQVTGVVRNALGPGKSVILCELTDPRVQNMGAVAGMSGSPLYIDGKLAGALSYQVQRFETVRYAGFTPAADMGEVADRVGAAASMESSPIEAPPAEASTLSYRPLKPVFTLGGLSPAVAELMAPHLAALGLNVSALGGSTQGSGAGSASIGTGALHPGDAVSVALATGDITLAGTGTVSSVTGNRIIAFGHPMLGLGDVQLPICATEVVTILPSTLESTKVANVGQVIGSITQDRLSAVSGTLGAGPEMIDVDVSVAQVGAEPRKLRFQVARQQQLTPVLIATGLSQALLGSNDAGLSNGFRLNSDVTFSPSQELAAKSVYAGPQAFMQGLNEFVQGLAAELQNPYEKTFPNRVSFTVEPLEENPAVTVDLFQISRSSVRGGEWIQATLAWRDFQGDPHTQSLDIPISQGWAGKRLEVIAAPGRMLDELTGRPRTVPPAQLRSFDAYLKAVRQGRPADGICVAVVEKSALFTDQTAATPEAPASIARIAHAADEDRFQQRDALLPLWETHMLSGKVATAVVRRALQVVD